VETDGRAIERNDAANRVGDGTKQRVLREVGDHQVVDLEQRARPLGGLRHLGVERADARVGLHVLHGHRDLRRHLSQEADVGVPVLVGLDARDAEGAEALPPRHQRQHDVRAEAGGEHALLDGKAQALGQVLAHERLPLLEHPAGMAVRRRDLRAEGQQVGGGGGGLQDGDPENILVRVVEKNGRPVERHHLP